MDTDELKKLTYALKDENGGAKLNKRGQIIIVTLSGACGSAVINFYAEKLKILAESFHGQPWAYLCNGKDFHATTPEAQKTVVNVYRNSIKLGCCLEAYCYDSPVGKAQTQQIMLDGGNNKDIEDVLFKNEQLAEAFLLKELAKKHNGRT